MNTKVIDLTKNNMGGKIEFLAWWDDTENIGSFVWNDNCRKVPLMRPDEYDNVMLLARNRVKFDDIEYDLIWAYDNDLAGSLYLGHWNSGVV